MEEPGGLQSMGSLRVGHDWATSLSLSLSYIGEGNGNPLQYSCLENPRDGGVWWAAVYGVTQNRTRLKQLSSSSSKGHSKCESVCLNFSFPPLLTMTRLWVNRTSPSTDVRPGQMIFCGQWKLGEREIPQFWAKPVRNTVCLSWSPASTARWAWGHYLPSRVTARKRSRPGRSQPGRACKTVISAGILKSLVKYNHHKENKVHNLLLSHIKNKDSKYSKLNSFQLFFHFLLLSLLWVLCNSGTRVVGMLSNPVLLGLSLKSVWSGKLVASDQESVTVGAFTPQKLASTKTQGFSYCFADFHDKRVRDKNVNNTD